MAAMLRPCIRGIRLICARVSYMRLRPPVTIKNTVNKVSVFRKNRARIVSIHVTRG